MKLIEELINKRFELYQFNELNHNYLLAIWHFYQVYNICLAIVGYEDPLSEEKNKLMKKLVSSFNFKNYSKMQSFMKKDNELINVAIEIIQLNKQQETYKGDVYRDFMVAVSIYD